MNNIELEVPRDMIGEPISDKSFNEVAVLDTIHEDLKLAWTVSPEYAVVQGTSLLIKDVLQTDNEYGVTVQTRVKMTEKSSLPILKTIKAPICDECPRKEECTFMCENRIDQLLKEEAESNRLHSSPKLINQDKYVGIERSHWTPKEPMPLSGWAETISGKFSPAKPKPAIEVISLERGDFKDMTIYPKGFPVPLVCTESCDKVDICKLRGTGFDDLCKHHNKLGELVHEVHLRYPKTTIKIDPWVKSPSPSRMRDNSKYLGCYDPENVMEAIAEKIRVTPWEYRAYMEDRYTHRRIYVGDDNMVRESELSKSMGEEDNTFAAYSSQQFLDTWDDPEEGSELEYTMDTGMASPEKSQGGYVPSFIYRTMYRDRKILLGFESRRIEKTYVETKREWIHDPSSGNWSYREIPVIRTTSYRDDVPIYKWISLPTLRPIGCYLKPGKVVGSSTVVTRKERKFGHDMREVERQARRHERIFIAQDEIDARKQVVMATC